MVRNFPGWNLPGGELPVTGIYVTGGEYRGLRDGGF